MDFITVLYESYFFVCLFIHLQKLVVYDESCSVIGVIKVAFTLWQFWSVSWITYFIAKLFFDAMYLLSHAITVALVTKMILAEINL